MENLIFGAFATLEGYREGDAANLGRGVYDRCTVVALCSAKARNPGCTVALVTNAQLPEPYAGQLAAAGVEVWRCPFDSYRVSAETNWALAYYKLCAMEWVLANREFARVAMLDLDTYTQYPLDDLWREADGAEGDTNVRYYGAAANRIPAERPGIPRCRRQTIRRNEDGPTGMVQRVPYGT